MNSQSIIEQIDTRQMAVGILHLNLGKAVVNFPGTTRSHPSTWVVINLGFGGPVDEQFRRYFPFQVIWYLWEQVLLPVLQNPDYQIVTKTGSLRNNINQQFLRDKDFETLLSRIENGIVLKLQETGHLPVSDPVGVPEEILSPVEDSEDASPVDSTRWPEGHTRLTYPVVD